MSRVLYHEGSGESLVDHPIPDAQLRSQFVESEYSKAEVAPTELQECYDQEESRGDLNPFRLFFQEAAQNK